MAEYEETGTKAAFLFHFPPVNPPQGFTRRQINAQIIIGFAVIVIYPSHTISPSLEAGLVEFCLYSGFVAVSLDSSASGISVTETIPGDDVSNHKWSAQNKGKKLNRKSFCDWNHGTFSHQFPVF